jgi:uncharacterized protein YdhG (YjbR/CyaY superfamily)
MATKQKETVDEFMARHETPMKAEVQAVRDIIKSVNPAIGEQIKWNAPSYFYNGVDLVTFNLWTKEHVHLVFHYPAVVNIESNILEGDYPTRRMTYLRGMADIEAKRAELARVVGELVAAVERESVGDSK